MRIWGFLFRNQEAQDAESTASNHVQGSSRCEALGERTAHMPASSALNFRPHVKFKEFPLKFPSLYFSKIKFSLHLHCWLECTVVKLLWRTVWMFLKKLKIELSSDPAIPHLGIYQEKIFKNFN